MHGLTNPKIKSITLVHSLCVISGFRSNVNGICTLLAFDSVQIGS